MNDAIRKGKEEKAKRRKPRRNQRATQLCMLRDDEGAEKVRDREGHNRAPQGYLDRVYVAEHDGMHQKETDRWPTVARAPTKRQGCGAGFADGSESEARRGNATVTASAPACVFACPYLKNKKVISMA